LTSEPARLEALRNIYLVPDNRPLFNRLSVRHAANSPCGSVGSTLAAELPPVAERELPERAACPKCHQTNTVKATETLATEIHFCIDCSQTFAVKKPLVTNPSSS
jgi:hypothetical protein